MKAAARREESEERCEGRSVILDVGGDRFVANRRSLERFPSTRYHPLLQLSYQKRTKKICLSQAKTACSVSRKQVAATASLPRHRQKRE